MRSGLPYPPDAHRTLPIDQKSHERKSELILPSRPQRSSYVRARGKRREIRLQSRFRNNNGLGSVELHRTQTVPNDLSANVMSESMNSKYSPVQAALHDFLALRSGPKLSTNIGVSISNAKGWSWSHYRQQ